MSLLLLLQAQQGRAAVTYPLASTAPRYPLAGTTQTYPLRAS